MNNMIITKDQIALMLSSKLGLSRSVCTEIINTIFINILDVAKQQKLTFTNFGSFEVVQKKSRPGVNFHTKLPITINEKKIIRFTPTIKLKSLINSVELENGSE